MKLLGTLARDALLLAIVLVQCNSLRETLAMSHFKQGYYPGLIPRPHPHVSGMGMCETRLDILLKLNPVK